MTNNLAQTFFVPQETYPTGVFLASIDLCFRSKPVSSALPVVIQLRPTVNGFPSSSEVIRFSEVQKRTEEITITDAPDLDNSSTYNRFTFPAPVYLAPGEYAVTVAANDPDYEVYTALLGDTIIGSTRIVSEQPYVGSFFKSSNGSTYTALHNEDLMFRLNKCVFSTSIGTVVFSANTPASNVNIDASYLNTEQRILSPATIQWYQKTTPNSSLTIDASYSGFEARRNIYYNDGIGRRVILASPSGENGKYYAQATMSTTNPDISPVIDTTRLSLIAIGNRVNNDSTSETGSFGGNAVARYITRRVTLADGFYGGALRVYLSAYKPATASIIVYYKILSLSDPDSFDSKSWQALTQITSTNSNSTHQYNFIEFQFSPGVYSDNISYISNSITYSTFSTYAIKVVMLSSDTTDVPRVKELRCIALPRG